MFGNWVVNVVFWNLILGRLWPYWWTLLCCTCVQSLSSCELNAFRTTNTSVDIWTWIHWIAVFCLWLTNMETWLYCHFCVLLVIGCGVGFCVQWLLVLVVVLMGLVVELVFGFLSLWGRCWWGCFVKTCECGLALFCVWLSMYELCFGHDGGRYCVGFELYGNLCLCCWVLPCWQIAWVLCSKWLRAWLGMSENWFLLLHGLFAFWSLVLGGFKCIWECWLFVVFIVWGRRKFVCFVDLCDVNVETICMLYRTGVLSYRVWQFDTTQWALNMIEKWNRISNINRNNWGTSTISNGRNYSLNKHNSISLNEQTQSHQFE